jgi:ribosomal protein S18 acetylase RimI-like enzyme
MANARVTEGLPVPQWRPVRPTDLDAINLIADEIHTSLPERSEVFEEKCRLFPEGCFALVREEEVLGYGISHLWQIGDIPHLDTFLRKLPDSPNCIFIHDVAVLPQARGKNAAGEYIELIAAVARKYEITRLTLVSVYNTDVLWSRYGFKVVDNLSLVEKLDDYGQSAKYMTLELG